MAHKHSLSESRLSIPMWDSSDPNRAPMPMPLPPGLSSRASDNIQAVVQRLGSPSPERKRIFGENTPPSATVRAMRAMDDDVSGQLAKLTAIASALQAEMSALSRRSKDNAADLTSLREATRRRDDDIKRALTPVEGPFSLEGTATVAMLEKIIREMATRDLVEDLKAVKPTIELQQFGLERHEVLEAMKTTDVLGVVKDAAEEEKKGRAEILDALRQVSTIKEQLAAEAMGHKQEILDALRLEAPCTTMVTQGDVAELPLDLKTEILEAQTVLTDKVLEAQNAHKVELLESQDKHAEDLAALPANIERLLAAQTALNKEMLESIKAGTQHEEFLVAQTAHKNELLEAQDVKHAEILAAIPRDANSETQAAIKNLLDAQDVKHAEILAVIPKDANTEIETAIRNLLEAQDVKHAELLAAIPKDANTETETVIKNLLEAQDVKHAELLAAIPKEANADTETAIQHLLEAQDVKHAELIAALPDASGSETQTSLMTLLEAQTISQNEHFDSQSARHAELLAALSRNVDTDAHTIIDRLLEAIDAKHAELLAALPDNAELLVAQTAHKNELLEAQDAKHNEILAALPDHSQILATLDSHKHELLEAQDVKHAEALAALGPENIEVLDDLTAARREILEAIAIQKTDLLDAQAAKHAELVAVRHNYEGGFKDDLAAARRDILQASAAHNEVLDAQDAKYLHHVNTKHAELLEAQNVKHAELLALQDKTKRYEAQAHSELLALPEHIKANHVELFEVQDAKHAELLESKHRDLVTVLERIGSHNDDKHAELQDRLDDLPDKGHMLEVQQTTRDLFEERLAGLMASSKSSEALILSALSEHVIKDDFDQLLADIKSDRSVDALGVVVTQVKDELEDLSSKWPDLKELKLSVDTLGTMVAGSSSSPETAERQALQAELAAMRAEKEDLQSIRAEIKTMRAEKDGLHAQLAGLKADVAGLEVSLGIRREELHEMNIRADALEKRVVEGLLNHSKVMAIKPRSVIKSPAPGRIMSLGQLAGNGVKRTRDMKRSHSVRAGKLDIENMIVEEA